MLEPLSRYVERFIDERPDNVILELEQVEAQAVNAAMFLNGFAELDEYHERLKSDPTARPSPVTVNTLLSYSEWALLRPLFLLYIEREQAFYIESTRGFGVDVFGRSTSEVAGDIAALEADMPRRAFSCPIFTV